MSDRTMAVVIRPHDQQDATHATGASLLIRLGLAASLAMSLMVGSLIVGVQGLAFGQTAPIEGFADLVETVAPAVVNISTRKDSARAAPENAPELPPGAPFEEFFREFFDRDQQPQQQRRNFSLGSGFVIDPDGFVVTNNHVVEEADEITVIFNNEEEYDATLVGRDKETDLALLKIERDNGEPFPFVEWADSDQVRVGDWTVAIGNPFGLGSTVTAGIVSARGRDIQAGRYDDFFQLDAAINRGNSGGPSFTLEGTVLGVNTAIFSPSGGNVGIGFAIPANLARGIIDDLKDQGRVARGWLGVRIQSITDPLADSLGLDETAGALVASVTAGGPAADAGIKAGDVILQFDGKKIERMRSLPRVVAETDVNAEVNVVIWRDRQRQDLKVTLGELPSEEELATLDDQGGSLRTTVTVDELGITLSSIDDELRQQYSIPEGATGVVITEVAPDSPADAESLRPGDVIKEVQQQEVGSPPEVYAQVRDAISQDKKTVLLLVNRQGDLRFVAPEFASE